MAKHEFGIIEDFDPAKDYDREYVPEQYGCISIEDDLAQEAFMSKLSQMPTFFHTGRRPAKGFAYYGITAFPTTFMIDKDGNVFGYVSGTLTRDIMDDIIRQTKEGVRK